ncbi:MULTISPECIES: hypothetical protein [Roseobacteraceae]|uniref:Periplasmic protein-like protein n=1 Tax=Pseudosulfitobacter pseudonitzschiae TaxID=1402135 RepID=A0A221K1G0_9RHOB|nr:MULTISPECIES: hypothetical protein [Roseobacteraceae]ASM72824.1 hypothetical protein SULPSESMR1_02020 [Pseudosulfitobacter pseudonitzschiae]
MSEPAASNWPSVSRILAGVLVFQLGLGLLLVIGDMAGAGLSMPSFGPDQPQLTEPVGPGDQRRTFDPDRPRPSDPANPLPGRLTLTELDGATYRLEGTIAAKDAARIIALITTAAPAPERLVLQSPGGSVADALELGRFIREKDIATEIRADEVCYSSCPYLLAAGTTRTISETASVGVHQHYFGQSTILPASFAVEDIQRGQGEVMIYLDGMGIDPLVMQHALTTPPDEIYILLPGELARYNFTTDDNG